MANQGRHGGDAAGPEEPVSVVIRKIAPKMNQHDVKEVLDAAGFRGKFAFVYTPFVEARADNVGYTFVGFRNRRYAEECYQHFNGRAFGASDTSKPCRVEIAKVQGDIESLMNKRRRKQKGVYPEFLLCYDEVDAFGSNAPRPAFYSQDGRRQHGRQDPTVTGAARPQDGHRQQGHPDLTAAWRGQQQLPTGAYAAGASHAGPPGARPYAQPNYYGGPSAFAGTAHTPTFPPTAAWMRHNAPAETGASSSGSTAWNQSASPSGRFVAENQLSEIFAAAAALQGTMPNAGMPTQGRAIVLAAFSL